MNAENSASEQLQTDADMYISKTRMLMSWVDNNTASHDWGLGNTSTLHSWICGGFSLAYNSLLIIVIVVKSPPAFGAYKYMMIFAVFLNMAVSSAFMAVIASMAESKSILFVQGGFEMPIMAGNVVLCVAVMLICQSIVTPCCLFYVRHRQICRNKNLKLNNVIGIVLLSMIISQIGGISMSVAAWPNATDDMEFGEFVWRYNIHRVGSYLVASLDPINDSFQTPICEFSLIYLAIMVVTSWTMLAFCWRRMVTTVGDLGSSNHTKNIHRQMKRVLLAQFLVPFIFVHLPFVCTCVAPLFLFATGGIAEAMPFIFATGPLIDGIMVTICVKNYRVYVFRCFSAKISTPVPSYPNIITDTQKSSEKTMKAVPVQ